MMGWTRTPIWVQILSLLSPLSNISLLNLLNLVGDQDNLAFGARYGSQFFQRTSDAVQYIMRRRGFDVIAYIDDYLGFGAPSVAEQSFNTLYNAIRDLGLTISQKKLVRPSTQAVCLGILVNTVEGTLSIPDDKLKQIKKNCGRMDG